VSIVVVAVMAVGGILALLTVDLTLAVEARARAQTAADAAALAAAQEIAAPVGGGSPASAASVYAERNGAALASCDCTDSASEATVTVTLPVTLVMLPDRAVRASARAVIDPIGSTGVVPGAIRTSRGGREMEIRRLGRARRSGSPQSARRSTRLAFEDPRQRRSSGFGGGSDDNHHD
jgi:secretion/DNA translocation related TadE-like protein